MALPTHINGLSFAVPHTELRDHLLARSEYHAKRATEKEASIPELEKALAVLNVSSPAMAAMSAKQVYNSSSPRDTIEDLKADIKSHRQNAFRFNWMAHHLAEAVYMLAPHELGSLEVIK